MKFNHTFRGWNDNFKNASFLPQTFIKKAVGFFAFFSILTLFNAVSIEAAIFTVTTNTDNEANGCAVGDCTFREAIKAADALAGAGTFINDRYR